MIPPRRICWGSVTLALRNPIQQTVHLADRVLICGSQPPNSLRSKFASSYFCKNVSRKGAKEQREKENTPRRYLGSFAPLREMFLVGLCCSASLRPPRLPWTDEYTQLSNQLSVPNLSNETRRTQRAQTQSTPRTRRVVSRSKRKFRLGHNYFWQARIQYRSR